MLSLHYFCGGWVGGWMGGWLENWRVMLSNVEVEVELGNRILKVKHQLVRV